MQINRHSIGVTMATLTLACCGGFRGHEDGCGEVLNVAQPPLPRAFSEAGKSSAPSLELTAASLTGPALFHLSKSCSYSPALARALDNLPRGLQGHPEYSLHKGQIFWKLLVIFIRRKLTNRRKHLVLSSAPGSASRDERGSVLGS